MEDAPVTAATGALGPVIAKLAVLLGSEYKLRRRTRREFKFIRSNLKPVHSILWNIWEREELDEASKALKMEALDLADDVEDVIFDFILSLERNLSNKLFVQTKVIASPFQDYKKRVSDVSGRCRSKWKERKKPFASLFSCGKIGTGDSSAGMPRSHPFVRKDASELVGMVEPRDDLIRYLVGEDETTPVQLQLKKATIYGAAGMGKTTLADQVYQAIGSKFQYRAFVSVLQGGSMTEVLTGILEQVAANSCTVLLAGAQASTEEHLIDIISNFLEDKRYLVIIDDIWNLGDLEIVMQSLPKNNLGSRYVGTTRIEACVEFHEPNSLVHTMFPEWDKNKGWVYEIGKENIITGMVAMKADLVPNGFDYEHPIVQMCGGTPLAVCCMLSAVAKEQEKQAHQGLHAKTCDVQDEIEKHVMENGIHNTPGFEPLVETLQLGFDGLPHHMLKTCLLYCSIYPGGHIFESTDLVRRWVSEGFVYKEVEANTYFEELENRGFILYAGYDRRLQPMMRVFLRWKSRQHNFITCSSEITHSNNNSFTIRRLCINSLACRDNAENQADPLTVLNWYHVRSLVIFEGIERVPFEKLKGLRLLDLCEVRSLQDHHLKDICDLVRLRHLLGLDWDLISEIPPEIVRLHCLETLQAFGGKLAPLARFIGDLQQLKTLDVTGCGIKELPREICELQQLRSLNISHTSIQELPRDIGRLQQLETLDMRNSGINELPKEIGDLQLLKTLDIGDTRITQLPKMLWKLQHLEHLIMDGTNVAKIPREIAGLKELKSLKSDGTLPLEVCHASAIVKFPKCIRQILKKSDMLLSELDGEMLSFKSAGGGLVVGAKQMHIPTWIKEHFNDVVTLDIRICKLEEKGLTILREMNRLTMLTLSFEVVPRDPVVVSSEGFKSLYFLTIDSRVPRVAFQEGAMPRLAQLIFKFKFYAGPSNKDPVGINHLKSLTWIEFKCNQRWYGGQYSPCILHTIDVVRKEALQLPSSPVHFTVCDLREEINSPGEISSVRYGAVGIKH